MVHAPRNRIGSDHVYIPLIEEPTEDKEEEEIISERESKRSTKKLLNIEVCVT